MTDYSSFTDDALVKAYAKGNNEAFDALLNRYKNKIYTYILCMVRDEAEADDLFQETFVKVLCSIKSGRYQAEGKFGTWVMRIARNLVLDGVRDESTYPTLSGDADDGRLFNASALADDSCEARLVYEQTLDSVRHLCQALPESQSEIVRMRYYQNLSFREIADMLGISINTALGRMRYALINMRRIAAERNIALTVN